MTGMPGARSAAAKAEVETVVRDDGLMLARLALALTGSVETAEALWEETVAAALRDPGQVLADGAPRASLRADLVQRFVHDPALDRTEPTGEPRSARAERVLREVEERPPGDDAELPSFDVEGLLGRAEERSRQRQTRRRWVWALALVVVLLGAGLAVATRPSAPTRVDPGPGPTAAVLDANPLWPAATLPQDLTGAYWVESSAYPPVFRPHPDLVLRVEGTELTLEVPACPATLVAHLTDTGEVVGPTRTGSERCGTASSSQARTVAASLGRVRFLGTTSNHELLLLDPSGGVLTTLTFLPEGGHDLGEPEGRLVRDDTELFGPVWQVVDLVYLPGPPVAPVPRVTFARDDVRTGVRWDVLGSCPTRGRLTLDSTGRVQLPALLSTPCPQVGATVSTPHTATVDLLLRSHGFRYADARTVLVLGPAGSVIGRLTRP